MLEFLTALLVTTALMLPVLALLRRLQVVDVPNQRSSHTAAVPRGGGLCVIAGWAAGVSAALLADQQVALGGGWSLVVASVGVLLFAGLGLIDDLSHLSAVLRLGLQLVIAAVIATTIAFASTSSWPSVLVAFVGWIWLVSYVNAFNFMDGINAISAASALLAACWYGALAARALDGFVEAAAWALAGAAVAFLPWNAYRPKVFLGDVGSYGIGALIGVLALLTAVREQNVWLAVAPLVIYLADTSGTMTRRAARREPLMEAHRSHVYQRLLDVGLSHLASTAVVIAAGVVICTAALTAPTLPAVLVAAAVVAGYHCLPMLLHRRQRVGVAS